LKGAEDMEELIDNIVPLLPLRGITIFPHMVLHFDVGRTKSILALEDAMVNNQVIFLVSQKDHTVEEPTLDDIYKIGTVSKIKQILKLPGDTIRVLVEGMYRADIGEVIQSEPFFKCSVIVHTEEESVKTTEAEASMRQAVSMFEDYVKQNNTIPDDVIVTVNTVEEPGKLADIIISYLILKQEQRQELLEAVP
jgi:ATP-dependent Lon protease